MTKHWLMKSEPSVFGIDHLAKQKISPWEGVRNYQARNYMRDQMKIGDKVLIYHSNANPSGIAGEARVCHESYPDHFAWNPKSNYFDPKSTPENPVWWMVDVEYIRTFTRLIPLKELHAHPALSEMIVLKKGSRLSIQPVTKKEFEYILKKLT